LCLTDKLTSIKIADKQKKETKKQGNSRRKLELIVPYFLQKLGPLRGRGTSGKANGKARKREGTLMGDRASQIRRHEMEADNSISENRTRSVTRYPKI